MDGDMVMMDVTHGSYFAISGLGASIWKQLEVPVTSDEILEMICTQFAVERDHAAADLQLFLDSLLEKHLIHWVDKV